MPQQSPLQQQLVTLARESAWFMPLLQAVRELGLASWCIGAGSVRNLVWDALHGFATPTPLTDIDVAYFDGAMLNSAHDTALQARLSAILPEVPWEVTNQAAVHLWFQPYFGLAMAPLRSLDDAVASWPEYATAVGLRLEADGALTVIAPHGLDDLFAMRIRRNAARVSLDTYRRRVEQKRYSERWPKVQVLMA